MFAESIVGDIRYAIRGMRRSPLFAFSVAATIGLGLGVLCSAVTIVNAYVLKPIELPEARSLYGLSWDTATTRRHRFRLADVEAIRESTPLFSGLTAATDAVVMHNGTPLPGRLVTGNYFQVLGAQPALGRTLFPSDMPAPGGNPVVVLSDLGWRTHFGSDPAIVGKQITLGRERFHVVGVLPPAFRLPGDEGVGFWAPLTMARALGVRDPWSDPDADGLAVTVRLRAGTTESQTRAWLDTWLRQRFPSSESVPVAVRVESRATRIPLTGQTASVFALIVSVFALVLLVACANVTNLMLARGFGRQREIAVRLSLGGNRRRVVRQLLIEGLVLAVPAALVGLALTYVTARTFPAVIVGTFPLGAIPVQEMLAPLEPDLRVLAILCAAAVAAAVLASFAPAVRVTRVNLVRASKGEAGLDTGRSRLRTGLVAIQIGACVLFLVGAFGLIDQSKGSANPTTGLNYELVSSVRVAPNLRAELATRLAADAVVQQVAIAWRPPLVGPLRPIGVVASTTHVEQDAGFMVVSPEYFPLFGIRLVRGRAFTKAEADEGADVALVSQATARLLWPGIDPIGQTLEVVPARDQSGRRPPHTSVRVIGVTQDVMSGLVLDGIDKTCVYFPTGVHDAGDVSILVRARSDIASVKTLVASTVDALERDAPVEVNSIVEVIGVVAWVLQAVSVTAGLLGVIGLALAFSGTYAVVAFLVTQRTREFGIRMAIGATVRQIVTGLLTETLRTAFVGVGAGIAIAIALDRMVSGGNSLIPMFGLRPYAVGAAIVLFATVTAALVPSLRGSRIDPSKALRAE
ncbi:MAG TPA: ABC transporter permease [Vicinamibacterales bacterium]